MRQGISTRYLGPTNSKGSRIKAIARKRGSLGSEMSLTRSFQYRGTNDEHTLAAKELATKLGWGGLWIAGGKPEEDGNMYVNAGRIDREQAIAASMVLHIGEDQDWFFVPFA